MIKSFDDAFKILDTAISEIDAPALRPLVAHEVELVTQQPRELVALGVGHAEDLLNAIDREVRANPMLVIGGIAALGLAAGFLISREARR